MTVTFAVTVHTADPHAGAEPVDAVLAMLLGRGFDLLTGYEPSDLVELPVLEGWSARVDRTGRLLDVHAGGELFYSGDLGAAAPAGWHATAARRGRLVVLAVSQVDLFGDDRTDQIRDAQRSGRAVAAQIPYTEPPR
ncbi:hypothetical protein I4I78_03655 [Pseudonocardia sp. KRD-291]|nr:hypothetical protein [Pseudonocardia sp. KRD291]